MLNYLIILAEAKKAKMDERGASAVEYGLLVAGIAALIVAIVFIFGDFIQGIFEDTCNSIDSNMGTAGASTDCS